ncbi:MAG: hypothetical protein ACI841_001047 [Planctomycetota bacterium]|jgi:hypothetical protein
MAVRECLKTPFHESSVYDPAEREAMVVEDVNSCSLGK